MFRDLLLHDIHVFGHAKSGLQCLFFNSFFFNCSYNFWQSCMRKLHYQNNLQVYISPFYIYQHINTNQHLEKAGIV